MQGIEKVVSYDEGTTWGEVMPVVTDVTPIANPVKSSDGGTQYLLATATVDGPAIGVNETLTKGDLIRVILKRTVGAADDQQWVVSHKQKVQPNTPGAALPPTTGIVGLELHNTAFRLLVKDQNTVRWFDSTDALNSFTEAIAP